MAQENNNNSIYDDMKQESYRAMLNSEIQASVAKQNALKYTQNQLNQTGYANQGVAQSTNLGIENNYRNALVNAQNQYRQDLMGIKEKEQASWAENGQDLAEFLGNYVDENGNITDMENYKKALTSYGVTFDGAGTPDFSNSKLDDRTRQYYQTMYELQNDTSNKDVAVANSEFGLGYDNDGFYVGSNGFGKDVVFDRTFDDKTSMKVSGIAKGQIQKHDDDIDVNYKGKNYDLDIEWEGKGNKDGNQRITETTFNSAVAAIAKRYPNPQSDQLVVYKNMVFFYDKERARWGYVQKNTGGNKLYTDLTTYLNGGSPKRWNRK